MLYKINAYGMVNVRSMGEYSKERSTPVSKSYQIGIAKGLRKGSCDYVYDEYWVEKVIEVLQPNEILLVRKVEGYYKLSLTTYIESQLYYIQWCEVNHLAPNKGKNITRFVKEVRCIWL